MVSVSSLRVFLLLVVALVAAAPMLPAQNDPASRRAAIDAMYPVMLQELDAKNFGRARNICDQAILWEPMNPTHHYNLACIEALAGGTRLPYAMNELEVAIALGFNDVAHLQSDPDLTALRPDAKFRELVQKLMLKSVNPTATILAPAAPPPATPATTKSATAPTATKIPPAEKPAPASFNQGVPVGLYFMTRFWFYTGTLEKAAWYFAPDGRVFQNLETGFSTADLTAHTGLRGTAKLVAHKLEVTWADGKKTASDVERDGAGFAWDMGIFTPVAPFSDSPDAVGVYEGGESLSIGGDRVAVSKRLELRKDGTFTWSGVSFVGGTTTTTKISAGSSGGSAGRWRLDGFSLILTDTRGPELRRIAFPFDDDKTPLKPDWMFFGVLLYKKQP